MKHITILLAFLITLSSPVAAQDFQKGYAAAQAGDFATALKEWKPLAEAGDADAQYNLALMYNNGDGVPQDYKQAIKWYRLAAEQGKAKAQYILATMYEYGEGVPQDYKEAVKWYKLSAEKGKDTAQFGLGLIYEEGGWGVLKDNIMAHMWYSVAASNGNKNVDTSRDILAKEMTPEAIQEAQAMARECMNSDYTKCGY